MSTIRDDAQEPVVPVPDTLQDIYRQLSKEWTQLHKDTLRMYLQRFVNNTMPGIELYVPSEKNLAAIKEGMSLEVQKIIDYIESVGSHMPFTTVENTPELAARVAKALSEKPASLTGGTSDPAPPKEREAGKAYTEKEMKAMTVTELKVVCKSFGLTTSGKKDDIIKRITTYHSNLIAEEVSVSEVAQEPDPDSESDADQDPDADQESGSDLELVEPDPDSSDPDL